MLRNGGCIGVCRVGSRVQRICGCWDQWGFRGVSIFGEVLYCMGNLVLSSKFI